MHLCESEFNTDDLLRVLNLSTFYFQAQELIIHKSSDLLDNFLDVS